MNYYEINEDTARRAKQMRSFDDYCEGSAHMAIPQTAATRPPRWQSRSRPSAARPRPSGNTSTTC